MYKNDTWVEVELSFGRTHFGYTRVFKSKYKANGEVDRYKARRVVKWYNKQEGVDYEETFSLVVKMVTIRCFISLVVQNDWKFFQMDVNNAILYGDLNEDVYMLPPPCFFKVGDKKFVN